MKMVLQLQSTKKYKNTDIYCGEATYLTDMLFDQTKFSTAEKEVRNVLENIAKIKMLTIKECAEIINGLSEHSIRKMILDGRLKSVRVGEGKRG